MDQQTTFFEADPADTPLATRMRPRNLEEFAGQRHLLGEGKVLRQLIDRDRVPSMVFWGPPGVGKTTLARIIARRTQSSFINFSAVTSGIKEIKEVMNKAAGREHDTFLWTRYTASTRLSRTLFCHLSKRGALCLSGPPLRTHPLK